MRILIIEDEISKERDIVDFLQSNVESNLIVRRSIMSGKSALNNEEFDVMLLDMTLPLYDNDDSDHEYIEEQVYPFGGVSIIEEIDRMDLKSKVIIVSAFDRIGDENKSKDLKALTLELQQDFPGMILDSVFYNITSNDWKSKMLSLINSVEGDEK